MTSVVEGIEFAVQDVVEFDRVLVVGEKQMRLGQRLYSAEQRRFEILDVVDRAGRRARDRLHHNESVLDAMMQFTHEQSLLFFGAFAIGDVHQHVHRPDQTTRFVSNRGRVG